MDIITGFTKNATFQTIIHLCYIFTLSVSSLLIETVFDVVNQETERIETKKKTKNTIDLRK